MTEEKEIHCQNFAICNQIFECGPFYDQGFCSLECGLSHFLHNLNNPTKDDINQALQTLSNIQHHYKGQMPFCSQIGIFPFEILTIKKANYYNHILNHPIQQQAYIEVVCNQTPLKIGVSTQIEFPDCFSDVETGWAFHTFGQLRHDNNSFGKGFGWPIKKGSRVGCLYNPQNGTISYFNNKEYMGVGFRDEKLVKKQIYFIVAGLNGEKVEIQSKGIPERYLEKQNI